MLITPIGHPIPVCPLMRIDQQAMGKEAGLATELETQFVGQALQPSRKLAVFVLHRAATGWSDEYADSFASDVLRDHPIGSRKRHPHRTFRGRLLKCWMTITEMRPDFGAEPAILAVVSRGRMPLPGRLPVPMVGARDHFKKRCELGPEAAGFT